MASTTSVISLFVLLLATYCYSVPIEREHDITTPRDEFSTDKILIEDSSTSMIIPVEQTTVHSMTHHKRKDDDSKERESHESHEITTSFVELTPQIMPKRTTGDDDRSEEITTVDTKLPKRGVLQDDTLFSTTEFIATSELPHHERTFEDDSFTTLESSTDFNARVPRIEEEKHDDRIHDIEISTIESTSALDSFGKTTGFLRPDEDGEKPTTTKSEIEHRIIKTETIIPGKITETKIYSDVPSRTYVVDEPLTTESSRLTQDKTMSHASKVKPDY